MDGIVGSFISLYRFLEEEKRVTVIKVLYYSGIGFVDEFGIFTVIRTVGNVSMCVVLGLCIDFIKDGLSVVLCIFMVLYNEDCFVCYLSFYEYYVVCGRERELSVGDNYISCFFILIKNYENYDFVKR